MTIAQMMNPIPMNADMIAKIRRDHLSGSDVFAIFVLRDASALDSVFDAKCGILYSLCGMD